MVTQLHWLEVNKRSVQIQRIIPGGEGGGGQPMPNSRSRPMHPRIEIPLQGVNGHRFAPDRMLHASDINQVLLIHYGRPMTTARQGLRSCDAILYDERVVTAIILGIVDAGVATKTDRTKLLKYHKSRPAEPVIKLVMMTSLINQRSRCIISDDLKSIAIVLARCFIYYLFGSPLSGETRQSVAGRCVSTTRSYNQCMHA